jgi:hypothetical protein
LGRFIQADTLVPDPADPQSLNRFAHVRNNPLAFVDPSGHQPNDWYMHDFDGSDPSPLADLWMLRYQDDPSCPACSTASLDHVQWYGEHPGYAPENDRFLAKVNANDGVYGGILPSDVRDASLHYSLARTADQLAHGAGWEDLAISAVVENGPPLLAALGNSRYSAEAQAAKVHSYYADGTLVYEGSQPSRIAGPDPAAEGPHSVIRWDTNNNRVYQATEYDAAGNRVLQIDFTNGTYPSGQPRPGHPGPPHMHTYTPKRSGPLPYVPPAQR